MKTHVEFRSTAFPPLESEEDEINPGRWGRRLAEYLKAEFEAEGVQTEEIYCEDWGVALPIKNAEFPLWIGCGNYEEYEDGFLCFIEPSKPFIRRLFRKIETATRVGEISVILDKILQKNPEVAEVRWWDENEHEG
jgi:hypothetical protein